MVMHAQSGRVTDLLPFADSEYAARLDRVRRAAAERDIELLVVTDPKNICYLTGYDTYAFYVTQALLVPVSGDRPQLVVRGIDVTAHDGGPTSPTMTSSVTATST